MHSQQLSTFSFSKKKQRLQNQIHGYGTICRKTICQKLTQGEFAEQFLANFLHDRQNGFRQIVFRQIVPYLVFAPAKRLKEISYFSSPNMGSYTGAYVPNLLSEVEQEQRPSGNGDREAIVVGAGLCDGEGERAYTAYAPHYDSQST